MTPRSFLFSLLGLACALGIHTSGIAQQRILTADLEGSQEVPPTPSAATGWSIIDADDSTNMVRIFTFTEGITAVAAHLHLAPSGVNGPVIVGLAPGPNGTWTGTGTLTAGQYASMLAGDTYINVHSAAFPGGEIRGQVAMPQTEYYTARLSGAAEVPPNPSTATGIARIALHRPSNIVTYEVETTGLVSVVAAHIHGAPVGVNGPVLHGLTGASGQYCGVTAKWTPAQLAALVAGDTYVNVHTAALPGGEIRGQVSRVARFAGLTTRLSGAEEVPPVATGASGVASVQIGFDRTIAYDLRAFGLTATAAHIHTGAVGVSGPVTIPLVGGPNDWVGTAGPLTTAQIADASNGLWYVNVHTAANPGGEIRGQLRAVDTAMPLGGGCPGSSGASPALTASSTLQRGLDYRIDLRRAAPAAGAAMFVGFSRTPFPIDLTTFGFTDCFLQVNVSVSVPMTTSALGCASQAIAVPPAITSIGLPLVLQSAVIDFGANPANVVLSNALASRVQ